MRYAQIDENGVCVGVSDLHSAVDAPHMIPIGATDSPVGQKRVGDGWEDVPVGPPNPALAALAPWQFRAMLRMSGHEQAVKDFIAQLPEPQKSVAEAQLDYSLEYRRDHPLVENIRQVVGLTEVELDTLWQQGLALTL